MMFIEINMKFIKINIIEKLRIKTYLEVLCGQNEKIIMQTGGDRKNKCHDPRIRTSGAKISSTIIRTAASYMI